MILIQADSGRFDRPDRRAICPDCADLLQAEWPDRFFPAGWAVRPAKRIATCAVCGTVFRQDRLSTVLLEDRAE